MSRVRLPPGTPKNNRNRGCFCYTWESVRLNKNAHCFAVEPSRLTLRFRCKHLRFAIASRRSFRLPPGTPKNNRNRGCFVLFSGESRAFFNAHCSAVEPSGWRFTFDASIFVTLFRRFAPSDSPRVHQWRCQKTTPQLYLPFGKSDCFAVIFCFAKLNFHFVKVKANIISLWRKPKFYRQRRFHSL